MAACFGWLGRENPSYSGVSAAETSTPHHMVEEACAHVQGESLKAHAVSCTRLLNSPIARRGSSMAQQQSLAQGCGAFAGLAVLIFGAVYMCSPDHPTVSSEAAQMERISPAQEALIKANPDKAFSECLLREGKRPEFTSSDGGQSAMLLMDRCRKEWDAFADSCQRNGGTDSDCTAKSVAISQMALKLLGK